MQVELRKNDVPFVAMILGWAPLKPIIQKLQKGVTSRECNQFVWCQLTKEELNELAGYLSLEANHNDNKRIAHRAGEIADCLEVQIR